MKKVIACAAAAASICVISGCSAASLPEGYEQFMQARELYERLDSARVTMTDIDSGEEIMRFSFYFTGSDEMVLSYYGCWYGEEQQAYSDGAEFFYKESGDEKWSVISSADENYIYNIYNRKYRYPYAEGRIFFLAPEAVENAETGTAPNGNFRITYDYDAEKLNSQSIPGIVGQISEFKTLATTLETDPDGNVVSFTESGTIIAADGEEMTLNMRIDVADINSVFDIPYPVDELYGNGEKTDG